MKGLCHIFFFLRDPTDAFLYTFKVSVESNPGHSLCVYLFWGCKARGVKNSLKTQKNTHKKVYFFPKAPKTRRKMVLGVVLGSFRRNFLVKPGKTSKNRSEIRGRGGGFWHRPIYTLASYCFFVLENNNIREGDN